MSAFEIGYLVLVIASIGGFALVLILVSHRR